MTRPASSQDLRPRNGARYVFEQLDRPDHYRVTVHLPDDERTARVSWDAAGEVRIEPGVSPDWVAAEIVKLARVLKRQPRATMTRWRPQPED